MLIQISAGQGPTECSIAVEKFCNCVLAEYPNSQLVSANNDYSGYGRKSAIIQTDQDCTEILGTIQWICKSPVRPNHKRKNWFIDVSEIHEAEQLDYVRESDCVFETTHSGGHGGQNVNKVESGVLRFRR